LDLTAERANLPIEDGREFTIGISIDRCEQRNSVAGYEDATNLKWLIVVQASATESEKSLGW
jgi:hypothetical protein